MKDSELVEALNAEAEKRKQQSGPQQSCGGFQAQHRGTMKTPDWEKWKQGGIQNAKPYENFNPCGAPPRWHNKGEFPEDLALARGIMVGLGISAVGVIIAIIIFWLLH